MDLSPFAGPGRASRLGRHLDDLLARAEGRPVPVSQVMAIADGRGYALAVFLLALPFVMPLPTLGMALPIGSFLALAGIGLAVGRRTLPGFLEERRIAYPALLAVARVSQLSLRRAGGLVRPRMAYMLAGPMQSFLGLSLACSALVLALPLPLPLSNFFPAAAILLLALGMLEGDGLLVLAGHVATAGVCAGLYLASGMAWTSAQRALAWVM